MTICPRCGEENPERARFCLACATPLAETPQPAEERKVVSVLFVDLVGFTDRSDRADPEDVRATLRPYHARLKQEIEQRGGTVEKFIGDAVMAVFGAPVAHEDDAERAVLTALRILDAIPELNEAYPELELAVRAAVNTGEAVVALGARPQEGEGIVAGDVVNTAARLQQAAPVGGVVVGEVTYRATRHEIDYEELEPVTVKGKAEPIPIWRALGSRTRFGVDVAQSVPTPFIGREHELALLKDTFARTVRESSVQLVTVTGEPGVGKTRLVTEFRTFLDYQPEIVFWRQGRCLPYGEGITFWALGEIVKGQAGILESDSPAQAAAKLEAAVAAVVEEPPERDWLKVRLAPLVGIGEGEAAEREESFTAWRRFLEGVAVRRPLVVVVEDLHWADPALLEFLEYLVDWGTAVPLLVVATARPELYERHPGWGGGKRNSTTIALSPLTDEETARLLAALLERAVLPAETQAALLERAEGNPLYAEEFVRMLTDRGLLVRRGRAVELAADGDVPLPETVHALVAARLDTLSPERKSLLHDAAVVGKVFWPGAVASIGGGERDAVLKGLRELVRKEFVRPSRTSSVSGEEEFAFWHLLVRDVAYQQIPRAARARKHRAAAEWIERIAEERVGDHAEILTHHYLQALDLAKAAGAEDEAKELEAPARRFLVMAGDRAKPLDFRKAEDYYRRALALYEKDDAERAGVLIKAAETAALEQAETDLEEALALARANRDELGTGRALPGLGRLAWIRGHTARARALNEDGTALLERYPPGPELAWAYARRAGSDMLAGRARECLASSEKALELARKVGAAEEAAKVLQYRGGARCELGDLGGLQDLRDALASCLEHGFTAAAGTAYSNLGSSAWHTQSPVQALEIYLAGIEFAERHGMTANAMWLSAEKTWMLYDLGRWDELLDTVAEVMEFDRAVGGSQHGVIALPYQAQVFVRRGRTAEAAALADEFLPRARVALDPQVLAPVAALVERARGDLQAAVRLVDEFEELTRDRSAPHRARFLPDLVSICVAARAAELARSLVESIDVTIGRTGHSLVAARASVAEAEGKPDEAVEHYAAAAERWAEYGFAFARGQALLGLGRCLLALNRPEEAAPRLYEARDVFGGLGARPLVDEADRLLVEAVAVSS